MNTKYISFLPMIMFLDSSRLNFGMKPCKKQKVLGNIPFHNHRCGTRDTQKWWEEK